LSKYHSI